MKIKYIEATRKQKEITLLEILNWEDDIDREDICYENDSIDIEIYFLGGHKTVYIWTEKLDSRLEFDTNRISPEKIIESIMKTLGVECEDYINMKYTEITEIGQETTLLDILKWNNDNREIINYKTDLYSIEIHFFENKKTVYLSFNKNYDWLKNYETFFMFRTDELMPKIINEIIELTIKMIGVNNED